MPWLSVRPCRRDNFNVNVPTPGPIPEARLDPSLTTHTITRETETMPATLARRFNDLLQRRRLNQALLSQLDAATPRIARHAFSGMENLEPRLLYSATPLEPALPYLTYNAGGSLVYDADTDVLSTQTTRPQLFIQTDGTASPILDDFFTVPVQSASFDLAVIVDDSGQLVGGVSGDDLAVYGAVDLDGTGNYQSGVLLTGEVTGFSFIDTDGGTDTHQFTFNVTGGLLAPFYAGQDLAVVNNSEPQVGQPQFDGLFTHDFAAKAKGTVGAISGEPQTAALGDRVWFDDNQNGLQDDGEQGVQGVTVTLTGGGADGVIGTGDDDTTATLVTDELGNYLFEGLNPGEEYKVTFSNLPQGYEFTDQDVDADLSDADDSDADTTTGMTQVVTLAAGETNLTLDAGIFLTPEPGIDVEKFTNGVQADTADEAVEIAAGDDVTWTYEVTNTGNVAFAAGDIVIVDDAGTPDHDGDDFIPVLDPASDAGNDGILSPGETWVYSYTGVAQDLDDWCAGNSGGDDHGCDRHGGKDKHHDRKGSKSSYYAGYSYYSGYGDKHDRRDSGHKNHNKWDDGCGVYGGSWSGGWGKSSGWSKSSWSKGGSDKCGWDKGGWDKDCDWGDHGGDQGGDDQDCVYVNTVTVTAGTVSDTDTSAYTNPEPDDNNHGGWDWDCDWGGKKDDRWDCGWGGKKNNGWDCGWGGKSYGNHKDRNDRNDRGRDNDCWGSSKSKSHGSNSWGSSKSHSYGHGGSSWGKSHSSWGKSSSSKWCW